MPRKGRFVKTRKRWAHKPAAPSRWKAGDPLAAHPMLPYMNAHLEWMAVTGYSGETVRARRVSIRRFIVWVRRARRHQAA